MTELLILGKIIYSWKESLSIAKRHIHIISYRFLFAADVWIFLNLFLAILMSIPVINVFTHGTHITVAHVMGTTIGINSFLLFALYFEILKEKISTTTKNLRIIKTGFWLSNISLAIFWVVLIVMGILKTKWQMNNDLIVFGDLMKQLRPLYYIFFIAGLSLSIGIVLISIPLLKSLIKRKQ